MHWLKSKGLCTNVAETVEVMFRAMDYELVYDV